MSNKRQVRQPLPIIREKKGNCRKPWKGVAAIFIASIGFSLASQLVCLILPKTVIPLDLPALNRKLEDIKLEGDRYDFVFLGSSRVYRGVNPIEIDAEAIRQGCNIKTYNFGVAGLSMLEQKYVLDRLYESGIDIETIIVEPYSVPTTNLDDFLSDRRRFFYTWNNLPDLLLDQKTMPVKINNYIKRKRLVYFLIAFIKEQTGIGRVSHILFPQPAKPERKWDSVIIRGYKSLDDELGQSYNIRREVFVRRRASEFSKKVESAINNPGERTNSGSRFDLVLSVTDRIRDMKIEPAIIFMPKPAYIQHSRDLEFRLAKESTRTLPIINLNRPDYYGDLFNTNNFFDGSHLNTRGAMLLAGYLAIELCAIKTNH